MQTITWPSGGLETSNRKRSEKTGLANYTTSNLALKNGKGCLTVVGKDTLNLVISVLDTQI